MSTRVNFTKRVEIHPSSVKVRIAQKLDDSRNYDIQVEADLSELSLSGEFEVVLTHKAYGETRRFVAPGVKDLNLSFTHSLAGMRKPLEVTTQLEIVQKDAHGIPVIKAFIKNVEPEISERQSAKKSALKTKRDPDLQVAWRLNFSEGYPILHVSDKHGLYDQLMLTPQFDPLILPEVITQVFNWLVYDPELKDNSHVESWKIIFEKLGCERVFFDGLPTPNEEDGSMEDMTPALRAQISTMGSKVADKFSSDLDLLNRLADHEIGEE